MKPRSNSCRFGNLGQFSQKICSP